MKAYLKKTYDAACSFLKEAQGVTLLEILLVIGVVAAMGVGFVELTNRWANSEKNLSTARHMRIIHNAAESYITDNFTAILAAIPNPGDVLEIPVNDDGSPFFLKEGGVYLPSTFNPVNNHQQTLTVLVRNATVADDERIQAVVVSSGRPLFLQDATDIAQAVGTRGGLLSGINAGPYSTTSFSSIYGGWSTAVLSYSGLPWVAANATLDSDRAHLAAFIEVDVRETANNYLYRVDVPGVADANRMQADLNMGGNTFENLPSLEADRVNVAGNLRVESGATITGGAVFQGGVDVAGGLIIDGDIALDSVIARGNVGAETLQVNNDLSGANGAEMSAVAVQVVGAAGARDMNVFSLDVGGGDLTMTNAGGAGIGMVGGVSRVEAGAIGVGLLQGATINAGVLVVEDAFEIQGDLNISGTISVLQGGGGAVGITSLVNCYEVCGGVCLPCTIVAGERVCDRTGCPFP